MKDALRLFRDAGMVADMNTMTVDSPNRTIRVLVMRHGVAVEGTDTRRGGGIKHGKEVFRSWAQVTADSVQNPICQAIEEVCAYLDRETGVTLL